MTDNIYQLNKRIPDKDILRKFKDEFYIDQYGDLRNKIDRGPGHGKNQLAGIISKKSVYPHCSVNGKQWLTHCIVDYLHNGDWYPDIIDHIDRNPLHCNIHNLERSNFQDNMKNLSLRVNNKSGVTGIINDEKFSRFLCRYIINKKRYECKFNYYSKNKKPRKNIYYWSSKESAFEAAQLFNWLIRKQNGYSIDILPDIKINLTRQSKVWLDFNKGIKHFKNKFYFQIKIRDKDKNTLYYQFSYNHPNRKIRKPTQYYWGDEGKALDVTKTFYYILRKKYGNVV